MSDLSIGGYGGYGAGGRVEFDMFSASPSGIEQTLGVGKKGQAVGEYYENMSMLFGLVVSEQHYSFVLSSRSTACSELVSE